MKGSSFEGGYRVPCIARWPGKIPAGQTSAEPAVTMDLFATALAAARVDTPKSTLIDGRDILPVFKGVARSPHAFIFGHQGAALATIRDARWKLHVLKPNTPFFSLEKPGHPWVDARGPDGVTILAPYEQARPTEYPGVRTGDVPRPMQLFDLMADPAEQQDVSHQHPEVVERLKKAFDTMDASPR